MNGEYTEDKSSGFVWTFLIMQSSLSDSSGVWLYLGAQVYNSSRCSHMFLIYAGKGMVTSYHVEIERIIYNRLPLKEQL